MRKKRSNAGQFLRFICVLLVLALAIVVTIGVGQSIWSLAQEGKSGGKSDIVTSVKSESSVSDIKAQKNSVEETEATPEKNCIDRFAEAHGLSRAAWPEELIELLERNPDAEEFVLNYPLKKDQSFEIDLSEHEHCKNVPLFFQWDERWGYTIYGSNVMGLTGCGPTCLSMVCLYLLDDAAYTPCYVADFAEENGYYVEGSGSAWTLISEGGETLGLDVTEIPLDEKRIVKNLELGNPVVCIMGPGDFTTTGHFIVLADCKDGRFVVNDPNSKTNSERLWSYDEIKGQIKNLWVCRAK